MKNCFSRNEYVWPFCYHQALKGQLLTLDSTDQRKSSSSHIFCRVLLRIISHDSRFTIQHLWWNPFVGEVTHSPKNDPIAGFSYDLWELFNFKSALSDPRQFLPSETPFKKMKIPFYFSLKALFTLKIYKFLSLLLGHVEKRLD